MCSAYLRSPSNIFWAHLHTHAASCVAAGYTGCCERNFVNDCGVGLGVDRCYCDRACYNDTSCCDDITEVPCLESKFTLGHAYGI